MTDLIYDEFKEYEFESKVTDGIRHAFMFPNGYGASVVKHKFSYGYEDDLFELAVIKNYDDGDYHLCYETPITDDVLGYLTNDDVLKTLKQIKELRGEF